MKFLTQLFLIIVLSVFSLHQANATHVMGGEITYEYLGNDGPAGTPFRYRVRLSVYINKAGNSAFPFGDGAPATIGIFYASDGSFYDRVEVFPVQTEQEVPLSANCDVPDLEEVSADANVYEAEINLPFDLNGFHLVYDRCCKDNSILNLDEPATKGSSFFTKIPSMLFQNSSPQFTSNALPAICAGDTITIVNNAYDPDGDKLIYKFSQPYDAYWASSGGNPNPIPGDFGYETFLPPPSTIPYASTAYTVSTPFGSGSYAYINATTGLTEYYAPIAGNYVLAVDILEYRTVGGKDSLIGVTRRDLQFVVANCPANEPPVIEIPDPVGQEITVVNDVIYMQAGEHLSFDIQGADKEGTEVVISGDGVIFDGSGGYNGPLATIETDSSTGTVTSRFDWTSWCEMEGAYNFTIEVRDKGCPPQTTYNVYTVNIVPFAIDEESMTGDENICLADPVETYSVSQADSSDVIWSATNGAVIGDPTQSSVGVNWTGTTTGKLKLVETSKYGCKDSTQVDVSFIIPDTLEATSDTTICNAAPLNLSVQNATAVTWSPNLDIDDVNSLNPQVTPGSSRYYYVSSANSCAFDDSVYIAVTTPYLPANDTSLCPDGGDTLNVPVNDNYTYSWTPVLGLNNPSIPNPVVSLPNTNPNGEDMIYEKVLASTDTGTGCTSYDTVEFTIYGKTQVDDLEGERFICPYQKSVLYLVDNTSYTDFQWAVDGGTIVFEDENLIQVDWYGENDSAQVSLSITDANGCSSDSNMFEVKIGPDIKPALPEGPVPVCESEMNAAEYEYPNNFTGNLVWIVNKGDKSPASGPKTTVDWYENETNRYIVLRQIVTTDTMTCIGFSDTLFVDIAPDPSQDLSIEADSFLCEHWDSATFFLSNVTNLKNPLQWNVVGSNGSKIHSHADSMVVSDFTPGIVSVSLNPETIDGCTLAEPLSIDVEVAPRPSPEYEGPFVVCEGFLDSVPHTVNGWDNSAFYWSNDAGGQVLPVGNPSHDATVYFNWFQNEQFDEHIIRITETSDKGCSSEELEVTIEVDHSYSEVKYITDDYDNPGQIEVYYNARNDVSGGTSTDINLLRSTDGISWQKISLINTADTIYTDSDVSNSDSNYYYHISFENQCEYQFETDIHKSILLTATADDVTEQSTIEFNPYEFWEYGVEEYDVYRKLDEGDWEYYSSISEDSVDLYEQVYDNGEDGFTMCYRVAARKYGSPQYVSWSNEVCVNFEHPLEIYNAFTPNGDGKNENFEIRNLKFYTVEDIQIFNRWGTQVFQSNTYDNDWNGMYGGKLLPDGTYFYVIKFEEFEEPFRGSVLIYR